ncbi:MAG TPA: hypothetical protein VG055_16760 [Planctomycetaceae bacterium]|jgi:hypothetical protein|nr:hypothetical protein [Planctomycetaceae bacterium]
MQFSDGMLLGPSGLPLILVFLSFLEHAVANVLQKAFINGSTSDSLLDPIDGFLGSFKSRCDVAYCLGLITTRDKKDLETLAQIRNMVAHSVQDAEPFSREDVRELCDGLDPDVYLASGSWDEAMKEIEAVSPPQFASIERPEYRMRFAGVAVALIEVLDAVHSRTTTPISAAPIKLNPNGTPA